jgi:hypothetical protein
LIAQMPFTIQTKLFLRAFLVASSNFTHQRS